MLTHKKLVNATSAVGRVLKLYTVSLRFFLFICLFGVVHPTREFFTQMETSLLPVKGCKF